MPDIVFDEETIKGRYKDIYEIAEAFCDSYNIGQRVEVEIDPSLLFLAVVATYDDIARYKVYHLTDPIAQKSNAVKRAAFAVRWFMHFSPLIFPKMGHISGGEGPENADTLANAMFALHYALENLRQQTGVHFNIRKEVLFNLIYDLLYRKVSADSLILFFDTIVLLVEGKGVESVIEI